MNGIIKGIGIGMAVGGMTAYVKGAMAGSGMKKMAKKRAKCFAKTANGIMSDMKYIFK